MLTLVYVLVGLLLVAGLVGSVLPFLPGTTLIMAGALIYAIATEWTSIGVGRLLILVGLMLVAEGLDYMAGALGAKKFGGTRWAVIGAMLGGTIGLLFLGLPGLLLGPMGGAIAGEMIGGRSLDRSVRVGLGAFVGMAMGAAAKFALAVTMVGLFLWWTWAR